MLGTFVPAIAALSGGSSTLQTLTAIRFVEYSALE